MGTGDIPPEGGWAANSLWVFDSNIWGERPPTREEFVAWPPPGYVPYQVVYPRWSISYPGADFSQAEVTMTKAGQALEIALESVGTGYGENTLVWIPNGMNSRDSWEKPESDTTYRVTVNNVIIGGAPRAFNYNVIIFDPDTVAPTTPPSSMPWIPLLLLDD